MQEVPQPVTLVVSVTLSQRNFEWFEGMAQGTLTTVERVVGDVATDLLWRHEKPVYNPGAVESMTDEEIESAILDMETELDLRARLKDEEGSTANGSA